MFGRQSLIAKLHGHKKIKVNGIEFTIRKLNPLLDFEADEMPALFTDFVSRRKGDPDKAAETPYETAKKSLKDIQLVLKAGIVEPKIVETKSESNPEAIRLDDICANMDTAFNLYVEILTHSLNRFKGVRGLFFSARTRLSLYTAFRKNLAARP